MANNSTSRKTSRDLQAEKSKQVIYEAAFKLFSDKGFEETRISDICRKASCSVGAFYHHYPSKESLLDETFRIADEDFRGWKLPGNRKLYGKELILEYMKSYADLIIDTGLDFTKIFFTNRNKTFIKTGRPMQTVLIGIISRSIEDGTLSLTTTPEKACEKIFICARGIVFHWCLREGDFDLKSAMIEIIADMLAGMEA